MLFPIFLAATAPFPKSRASYFRFARFNTSALYYLRAWHRLAGLKAVEIRLRHRLTAYYRLLWNIGCLASEDSTLQGFKTFKPGSGLESSRPEECLAEGYAKLLKN